MTTAQELTVASFKLESTFSSDGVVHTWTGMDDEVWVEIKVIGRGGQGTVYLQQRQGEVPNRLRAVKKLSKDLMRSSTIDVMRELNTMMAVYDHNDWFVQLYGWFENPVGNIFLAMEYLPHGDLAAYLKADPDARQHCREITRQLLTGLSILHSLQICHRDLKPQNVLIASLTPMKVKLADFGISKSTTGTGLHTRIGTAHYMAPELVGMLPRHLRIAGKYTTAVDMWALGFIVHEVLTGETPFLEQMTVTMSSGIAPATTGSGAVDMYMLFDFCKGSTELPIEPLKAINASASAILFIKRLVVADPKSRATASEALLNPWITDSIASVKSQRGLDTMFDRLPIIGASAAEALPNPWITDSIANVKLKRGMDELFNRIPLIVPSGLVPINIRGGEGNCDGDQERPNKFETGLEKFSEMSNPTVYFGDHQETEQGTKWSLTSWLSWIGR